MLQGVDDPNDRITDKDVAAFEKRHEITLPSAYRSFLIEYNGGRPVPAIFPIAGFDNNPDGEIQALFGLNAHIATEDLDERLNEHRGLIPKGIVPIGTTGTADFVVLDLRRSGTPVLFWDRQPFWGTDQWRETDLYPVAASFESFLNALRND